MVSFIPTWATTDANINNPFEKKRFENFNFAVAGDFACDNNVNQTIASILNKEPELVIALGYLSYSKRLARYCASFRLWF